MVKGVLNQGVWWHSRDIQASWAIALPFWKRMVEILHTQWLWADCIYLGMSVHALLTDSGKGSVYMIGLWLG